MIVGPVFVFSCFGPEDLTVFQDADRAARRLDFAQSGHLVMRRRRAKGVRPVPASPEAFLVSGQRLDVVKDPGARRRLVPVGEPDLAHLMARLDDYAAAVGRPVPVEDPATLAEELSEREHVRDGRAEFEETLQRLPRPWRWIMRTTLKLTDRVTSPAIPTAGSHDAENRPDVDEGPR